MSMRLSEIMSTDLKKVTPSTSVVEAAKLMRNHDIGFLPVCEGDELVGVLTDRDICLRAVAESRDLKACKCEDIMSRELMIGSPDLDVHDAAHIMADEQIRRLPVIENRKLVGIVAIGDLAIETIFINEAGDALSDISKPTHH